MSIFRTPIPILLPAIALAVGLAGCASPTVKLATAEPLKVDIDVRLDVYQHSSPAKVETPKPVAENPDARRRDRMGEVQNFKNQRLVGEGRDGLLVIRNLPTGDYAENVRMGVESENADRMTLMKSMSEEQKIALPEIQSKQAKLWRDQAFAGEWIEQPGPDGTWEWVQKAE